MSFTRSYIDGTRGLQEPAEAFFFSMCLFESSVAGHSCFEPWFDLEHSYHCLLYTKWLLKLCLCFYSPLQRQQHHNHHHHQQQQDHTPELPVLRTVYTYDTYVRNRTLYACVQLLYSSSRTSVYLNPALEDAHPSALYREHSLIAALCGESQHIRSISTSLLKMPVSVLCHEHSSIFLSTSGAFTWPRTKQPGCCCSFTARACVLEIHNEQQTVRPAHSALRPQSLTKLSRHLQTQQSQNIYLNTALEGPLLQWSGLARHEAGWSHVEVDAPWSHVVLLCAVSFNVTIHDEIVVYTIPKCVHICILVLVVRTGIEWWFTTKKQKSWLYFSHV